MRRWPSYRVWRKEERQRRLSEFLFAIADRLPDWQVGSLPDLKFFAQHRCDETQRMSVASPDGIRIVPAFVSYYDVFFTEDFPSLQQGLARWCSEYNGGLQPFRLQLDKEIDELFRGWSRCPIGGAWSRVGHTRVNATDGFQCVEFLSMDLIQMSPVCLLLLIAVFPASRFVERFRDLISRDVKHTAIIHRIGLFSRRWHSGGVLPSAARQHELEEFFLEMNREVVGLLRRYIGRGWAARGPLPCIQVFTVEDSDEQPDTRNVHSEFWRSLSLTRIPELSYADNEGIEIVPPDWLDKGTFTAPYRCIVHTRRYLTEERIKSYATREYTLFHNLEYDLLHPLIPLLALRETARRSVDTLTALRGRVSPYIVLGQGFISRLKAAIGLLLIPPQLNSLQFESSRIRESSISRVLGDLPKLSFSRKTHTKDDTGRLTDDLAYEIRLLLNYVGEQLSLIRSAYQDLWNFAIQWILLVLTVVATVIAVAQWLPTKEKAPASVNPTTQAEPGAPAIRPPAAGGRP